MIAIIKAPKNIGTEHKIVTTVLINQIFINFLALFALLTFGIFKALEIFSYNFGVGFVSWFIENKTKMNKSTNILLLKVFLLLYHNNLFGFSITKMPFVQIW